MGKICSECKKPYEKLNIANVRYRVGNITRELEEILELDIELAKDTNYEKLMFGELKIFIPSIKKHLKAIENKCSRLLKQGAVRDDE